MPNRPKHGQESRPPAYIEDANAKYCYTCGRLIGIRKVKNAKASGSDIKYCSDQCKRHKPDNTLRGLDAEIDSVLLSLLLGQSPSPPQHNVRKGDSRHLVSMNELESAVLARGLSGLSIVQGDIKDSHLETLESDEISSGPAQPKMEGKHRDESNEKDAEPALTEQQQGQAQANQRKLIKNAARRAVVFGLTLTTSDSNRSSRQPEMRKCEAVVNGKVVEPSFAKGNWCIRWRDPFQPSPAE